MRNTYFAKLHTMCRVFHSALALFRHFSKAYSLRQRRLPFVAFDEFNDELDNLQD